jgi:hypothetical protein
MAGPAVAGVIVATIGPGWGLAIDGSTFALSALFLGFLRLPSRVQRQRTGTLAELRAGWRAFSSRKWLWISVAFFTIYIGFGWGPFLVLGPDLARKSLGGAGAWAAIATTMGVGAVAGGVIGLRWRPRYPLRAAFLVFLVSGPMTFALLGARAPLPLVLPLAALYGSSGPFFNTMWYTALQREVPARELSRVSSWDYLGSLLLLPVGQAVCGPIATTIGLSVALYGAGAVLLILLIVVLAVPAVRNFTLSGESATSRHARMEISQAAPGPEQPR